MNTLSEIDRRQPRRWGVLVLFLIVVVGAGSVIGILTAPGEWYAALTKPPFNPPNWIFAPVWLALYIMIAIAGWRTWTTAPQSLSMKFWFAQLVLNWLWSPVFFSLHLLWPGLVVITGILLLIAGYIAVTRKRDPLSAWLFVPYLAWVGFATLLNASLAVMN